MPWVRPADVAAMRARLAPAFAAVGRDAPPGSEAARLAADGGAWCVLPAPTLFDAPAALEDGRDLEARLALAQGPGRGGGKAPPPRAGEVLGMHTVGELVDLVAAERYQLGILDQVKACPAWAAADALGYGGWAAGVFNASAAMQTALDRAQSIIDLVPSAIQSVTPARGITGIGWDSWAEITDAAKAFVPLVRQFIQAGYCPWPDTSAMPQPKSPDLDLSAYRWADASAKKIEKAADSLGSGATVAVVAVVATLAFVAAVKIAR